jgi:hypothetical protein
MRISHTYVSLVSGWDMQLKSVRGGPELQGIKFGQELRASLPKWVGEISIRQAASRAVQPLFQASLHGSRSGSIGNERKVLHDLREIETSTSFNGAAMHNKGTTN